MTENITRCEWAEKNKLFWPYHDYEWGVVVHDDRYLFEMLSLEGAQAGLSWLTVLKKRDRYKQVFDNFDASEVALFDNSKIAELLEDAGIIRNRLKVNAVIGNAMAFLAVQQEFGSFDKYIWTFSDHKILTLHDHDRAVLISETMSTALKKRGFRFVGPTICYAYMQSIGIVNDHSPDCFKYCVIMS